MTNTGKKISVVFFKNDQNNMPVRNWLLQLTQEDRKIIGEDIKTVEFGWPIGMPISKPLGRGLYEVRSDLTNKKISRVIFTIYKNNMVLLHGFIKKDQKTPKKELNIAKSRLRKFSREKGREK